MKNKSDENNEDVKDHESFISENKIDDVNHHSNNNNNKNNMNNISKLLIDDDYYLIAQNFNELLKLHHKSIMQNIGKVKKNLINNSNYYNDDDESKSNDSKEINSLNLALEQIEANHNNFYLKSKKIFLKMNKHYNKRKNHLKKYKVIEHNKYSLTLCLNSKFKNNETDDIKSQINTQKYNNNSNQVIINNIQNIINTVENKANDIISNNLNQNDFSSLLKENQLLKQKLINISSNQKSEITNYINYIENKIKNNDNNEILIKEEEFEKKVTNKNFRNLESKKELDFVIISKNKEKNTQIIIEKVVSNLNILCAKENENKFIIHQENDFSIICNEETTEMKNLKKSNLELSDKNNELSEKINSLSAEIKKIKEEKVSIAFKNGLSEKKFAKINAENKKIIEQKESEIEDLNQKLEEIKLKNNDLEKQKSQMQTKIFNFMSKVSDLNSNYENLKKEKDIEINDYKEYLNQKEKTLEELKAKNNQSIDKIVLLENNIKLYNSQNMELKSEINKMKNSNSTFEFKIKQNDKTISYVNKINENLTKENADLKEQIKQLNKEIKELKKIIKEYDNKNKNNENEGENKDKEITDLKKAISSNREDIIKKENEIRNLNSELVKAVSENKKLSKDLDILEGENRDAIESFNDLNKKYKEINKELNHLKRYYEPIEEKLLKKEEELNISIKNYNFLQKSNRKVVQENDENKKLIEKYKKEIETNRSTGRSSRNNMEIIKENNQLKKEMKELDDEIEDLNKKIEDQGEKIIYYKSTLSNEQSKNIEYEKKIEELNKKNKEITKKCEDLQKVQNENKSMNIDYRSRGRISVEISSNENDSGMKDITPNKYTAIKCVVINDLKWYLFKKKSNNYEPKNILLRKYSQKTSSFYSPYSNKTAYNRHEKLKSNINEVNIKETYDDYKWKPVKNLKDFIGFESLSEIAEDNNKAKEAENEIKQLKDKLAKKEEDYNRVNINYAKLLKKTKNPDNNQDKLIETNNKLKAENKKLYNSLIKCKSEKPIIGVSFVEDDLEGSFFIDDFCFDTILKELNKNDNHFMAMNNTIQRSSKPYNSKKHDYIKLENNIKDDKDESDKIE